MNCPICLSELKDGHNAARHFSLKCGDHYSILYEFIAKLDDFEVSNESFFYEDIVIQKIYYRGERYPNFYWSIHQQQIGPYGSLQINHHLILNHDEFTLKFKSFNPNNISNIRERFDLFSTFS